MSTYWLAPSWKRKLIGLLTSKKKTWTLICTRKESGPWVFDVEPFILDELLLGGTDLIIDHYFEELSGEPVSPGSKVSLTVSTKPLENQTTSLEWIEEVNGFGNDYKDEHTGMIGWLCPVLQVLYGDAPKTLYALVEPIKSKSKPNEPLWVD